MDGLILAWLKCFFLTTVRIIIVQKDLKIYILVNLVEFN